MKIGLMTDAACDLPLRFLTEEHIEILPIHLHIGERSIPDVRDVPMALGFYKSYLLNKNMPAETSPLSVDEMVDFFKTLVPKYDKIICVTLSKTRSKIYEHATEASFAMAKHYHDIRATDHHKEHDISDAFSIRVIDSQALFTAEGILVYEAARMLREGMPYMSVIQHIQKLVRQVHGLLVPDDLYYMRMRARKKGDDSISFMRYLVGTALDMKPIVAGYLGESEVIAKCHGFKATLKQLFEITAEKIKKGLSVPLVAISYAGNPKFIVEMQVYKDFLSLANAHGVEVMVSVMSPTGGINVGPGAVSVAYAIEND